VADSSSSRASLDLGKEAIITLAQYAPELLRARPDIQPIGRERCMSANLFDYAGTREVENRNRAARFYVFCLPGRRNLAPVAGAPRGR
jgi:hypothetical protein